MQKLQLSIPEPCHENWQNMTPTQQGRFCNACSKEVIDFSMMTDTEVLNYFTSLTHDKVCGRALPSQLDRTISKPKDPKKRLFWYWNYIVMFFMFFGKGNGAKAQGMVQQLTAEQINQIKSTNVNNALAGKVAGGYSRIITGKVTDKDGIPVSFASIKIKGTSTGVSADANGNYSLRIKPEVVIEISAAAFKTKEVVTGNQNVFFTVLERGTCWLAGEVIIVGTMGGMRIEDINSAPDKVKNVAVIKVKDEQTNKAIPNVSVVINKGALIDTVFTDSKGMHKIKSVGAQEEYKIKITAEGYESNEFSIKGCDFKDRKKEWDVLLRKQKPVAVRTTALPPVGKSTTVRLGQISVAEPVKQVLYVVDGISWQDGADINPDDIDNYEVLQAPAAMAIYGVQGANGAIIITTRKAKEIKLKEVVINSEFGIKRTTRCGGVRCTNIYEDSFLSDTIATVKTLLTNAIKVYPNPVQRNTAFSVALQLKQAGNYSLQITDASGRILLTQKFNAGSKDHTEKVMSDGRWAGGIYYIRVFDALNKLISKSSFVFQ